MPELELTRAPGDKKLYVLEGVGSLRLRGWFSRSASAETAVGDRSWELAQRGVFHTVIEAYDAAGTPVGAYEPRAFRRGGNLMWHDHGYGLRPASAWKERYALTFGGDRELAIIEGKGWSKRPVKVAVPDPSALPPGLLLFTVYVVRSLAENAQTAATAGATAATTVAATG
ncbi:MAG TPA: hypothetical protein VFG42_15340 [Baekduia sp.]|uniref:hypothetical protein n=1 Tax=Baekduia sp. TaxID=2600305 RepID=UPI002D794265|nr:hypothetical protein [Baekduia sp.]HET6508164.1 hypothetical protein [Baekduia sp.]